MPNKNFITDEDAFENWCPFVRYSKRENYPEGGDDCNRAGFNSESGANCIGKSCMAWRWQILTDGSASTDVGYCGLAGNPLY